MFSEKEIFEQQKEKWRSAEWIVEQFPVHDCYVEPFGSNCSVLMSKLPSNFEVYNDRDSDIITLFNVIRDDGMRAQLLKLLAMTPYAKVEFDFAQEYQTKFQNKDRGDGTSSTAIMIAYQLLVRSCMSITKIDSINGIGFNSNTISLAPTVQELWCDLPDEIIKVTQRFRRVIIENTDAYNAIKTHDRKETLFYLDPPEILQGKDQVDCFSKNKMSLNVFNRILRLIDSSSGMFIINAYDTDFYKDTLVGWSKRVPASDKKSIKKGFKQKAQRCLWLSPECNST